MMKVIACFLIWVCVTACSTTRHIPENSFLLEKVNVRSDNSSFNSAPLLPYIRQKGNSRWFSLLKVPLGTYSLAGKDSTKWINRTLKKLGEKPMIYDSVMALQTCNTLQSAMRNMGYLNAWSSLETKTKGRKIEVTYLLHPGLQYRISHIDYLIEDSAVREALAEKPVFEHALKADQPFTIENLDDERKRLVNNLQIKGFYKFHKDFIIFDADTAAGKRNVDLTLRLLKYREHNHEERRAHPRYYIRHIRYTTVDDRDAFLRRKILDNSTALEEGKPFNVDKLQKTYNNFARLRAIRHTSITFKEVPDTNLLDCRIEMSNVKRHSISFQPEGTNTAGDLGAAASLTYENHNLFNGSELLSIQVRAAYEAITGLEGYQNRNYTEYGTEVGLSFPRFVAPFLSRSFVRNINASSELKVSYNLQNRPEFHRRVFSAGWNYRWSEPRHHSSYRLDVLDLNYIHMPWISETFRQDYLEDVDRRNTILRFNYEDLFIARIGFGVTYNNGKQALKTNIETAGNLLDLSARVFSMKKEDGRYKLFNIAYAQYVKADIDYTRMMQIDNKNTMVWHIGFGIAYPYGNSKILPFEKRYFSGGANSVRGWGVRRLGPGKYQNTNGEIDFINQTGDMKIDLNLEYRTSLFWKVNGALFVDAGNIWTLRKYKEQPGGQFSFKDFYKQFAVSYGVGIRFNLDYFILRFDMGMKAVNPVYDTDEEHYAILHPKFSRDFAFHFAVGLPF